jgi:hypothetical protein
MKDTTNHVSTGELNKIIGVTFPSAFVMSFGVQPAIITNTSYFWNRSDIPLICINLSQYFLRQAIMMKQEEAPEPQHKIAHLSPKRVKDIEVWYITDHLTSRILNVFKAMGIKLDMPLDDFCSIYTEQSFLKQNNFGETCLNQLRDALYIYGYKLKPH